jgi:hypothetical protein
MTLHRPLLLLALTALACAPEFGGDDSDGAPQGPAVTEEVDGAFETVLDGTAKDVWTHFDFESRAHVEPADPADDKTWDVGVLRFNVKTNGGTSGSGGAAVAVLDGTEFAAVTAPPTDGWVTDTATEPGVGGSPDAMTSPGYAFDNWFAYDLVNHLLKPVEDRVYVVRTPEGNHFKVAMLGYYDDAGTDGYVRFRWAAL